MFIKIHVLSPDSDKNCTGWQDSSKINFAGLGKKDSRIMLNYTNYCDQIDAEITILQNNLRLPAEISTKCS